VEPFEAFAAMDYQLILQFRGDSIEDYDATVALEEELIERLGDSADVDGHDCGSGETNIFIITMNPAATFRKITPVLKKAKRLDSCTVAYRKIDGEQYTVIWPEGSKKKFTVA
jgi:hypothetical protein